MMKASHILVVLVLGVAAVYFVSQTGGATEITQRGDDLSIAIGRHRLQATIVDREYSDSFLVIGGMDQGDLYFTAFLSAIPLDTAQELAERYGDFRRCGSPGAAAGMRSVESMALYAASRKAERTLKKINKLALAGKDPVIKITYAAMEITDHVIEQRGEKIQVVSQDMAPSFLVTDVQLVREGLMR